jgi:Cdc6-like AAA superfamily ATPase
MEARELNWDQLYHGCDADQFGFETTADLPDLTTFMGQPRVVEALGFGAGINREGYNIFALGQRGTGRHYLVRRFFEERAAEEERPSDYCYINKVPHKNLWVNTGMGNLPRPWYMASAKVFEQRYPYAL